MTAGVRILCDGARRVYLDVEAGTCTIAEGFWLPGIYADEATAWAAFEFPDGVLQAAQDRDRGVGAEYRPITLAELREIAEARTPSAPWPPLPGEVLQPHPYHRYATCHPTRLAVTPGHPWGGPSRRLCPECTEAEGSGQ